MYLTDMSFSVPAIMTRFHDGYTKFADYYDGCFRLALHISDVALYELYLPFTIYIYFFLISSGLSLFLKFSILFKNAGSDLTTCLLVLVFVFFLS